MIVYRCINNTCAPELVGQGDLTLHGECSGFVTAVNRQGHKLGRFHRARFQAVEDRPAPAPALPLPEAAAAPIEGLPATLAARGSRYGSFETNGSIAQELKRTMRRAPKWGELTGAQAEALDMFASKISRMLTGDPSYVDSWHDIAGYATLVEDTLPKN